MALAAEDDFVTLRVSAPSDSRELSAFTHGLTPVVLSGALIVACREKACVRQVDTEMEGDTSFWKNMHQELYPNHAVTIVWDGQVGSGALPLKPPSVKRGHGHPLASDLL